VSNRQGKRPSDLAGDESLRTLLAQ
jgi:hypothetical protein